MVSKITSTRRVRLRSPRRTQGWPQRRRTAGRRFESWKLQRNASGFTLMELMVATVIAAILGLGTAALVFYSAHSFAAIANYVDLDHRSRIALDTMFREIRQANRLTGYTQTSLTFEDYDGAELKFEYDSTSKTLTRSKGGLPDSESLLTECVSLQFSIFQRNPIGGTYDQFPTATPDTCKLVQLRWTCARKILGVDRNTESVQSAKIVIRKQ
ncbi:MAG: prepilin-type N-terminal cleavage/methylation domain-containing protein [Verrucomicrobia bacterium]|nr:prepilin-type N-terminal cleavage/methylation domain-containing protein [Verrucomicrobiota bacterium]